MRLPTWYYTIRVATMAISSSLATFIISHNSSGQLANTAQLQVESHSSDLSLSADVVVSAFVTQLAPQVSKSEYTNMSLLHSKQSSLMCTVVIHNVVSNVYHCQSCFHIFTQHSDVSPVVKLPISFPNMFSVWDCGKSPIFKIMTFVHFGKHLTTYCTNISQTNHHKNNLHTSVAKLSKSLYSAQRIWGGPGQIQKVGPTKWIV